jgi:putative two-component system response regulator
MVVDDQPANVELLCAVLSRGGYRHVRGFHDPAEARAAYPDWRPDLLLLDLHMPKMSGFELATRLREDMAGDLAPVIMLTADTASATRHASLATIARDHITKPFDVKEVLLRIENVLSSHLQQAQLEHQSEVLFERIRAKARDLEAARVETLERLALAAEFRDHESQEHAWRVGRTAALLAERLGLAAADAGVIGRAAVLHDVGKIGIADSILLKNGRLAPDEWAAMEQHTVIGASILAGSSFEVLQVGEIIARTHHERCDGRGYPDGTHGDETPLVGRIVAVADVYDALTHARPYKLPWSVGRACGEIQALAGSQLDPDVVRCFAGLDPHELLRPVAPAPAG